MSGGKELPSHELPDGWEELVAVSRNASSHAYAPYSSYLVGACVLSSDGQLVGGCNIENASYGLTVCAGRVAAGSAVASGQRDLVSICISATGIVTPCGARLQDQFEFNPDMLVILDDVQRTDEIRPTCVLLRDLLPGAFSL